MMPPIETRRSAIDAGQTAQHAADPALKLADLSLLPRWGIKGSGIWTWLDKQGAATPARDNIASTLPDGSTVARLSPGEALILSSFPRGEAMLAAAFDSLSAEGQDACYPVPRQDSHCWLVLEGHNASLALAKLCGVDLAADRFAIGSVAQTSVARLSAIVIRNERPKNISFSLLADSASAQYLWDCVIDAITEFSGAGCTIEALQPPSR